jgi:hypothetical protein
LIGRSLILFLALATAVATPAVAETVVRGLDHIPLAVTDLDASKADFEALGFVLKPGRPHANGLRNAHVKFPDGTEIELITAHAATDAITSEYHTWLRDGDGPAFLGLYAPDLSALIERVSRLGFALERKGGLGTFFEPVALRRPYSSQIVSAHPRTGPSTSPTRTLRSALRGFGWLAPWPSSDCSCLGAAPIEEPPCGTIGSQLGGILAVGR